MRRMISQKLIDFVKKLSNLIGFSGSKIEVGNNLEVDGDVTADGGDISLSNLNGRALKTPLTAPLENTLVGVGTGNEQIQVKIGEGLQLEGDTSPYTLKSAGGGGTKLYKHTITLNASTPDSTPAIGTLISEIQTPYQSVNTDIGGVYFHISNISCGGVLTWYNGSPKLIGATNNPVDVTFASDTVTEL